jgi:hypothetical protein
MASFYPGRLGIVSRRRAFLAIGMALAGMAAVPVARAQHPLPQTHSNYIHSLEDPKRAEWQKPEEVQDFDFLPYQYFLILQR